MNENIKHKYGRTPKTEKKESELRIPSLSCGLSHEEVSLSREKHGKNTLKPHKRAGFIRQFFRNLNDPIIKILICALVVNTAFMFSDMNWAESIGIAATVLISALVTTISEYSSGASFDKLYSTLGDCMCHVLRDGETVDCAVSDLVKYDLVYLYPGDTVPADGILLQGEVACDESPLTGESKSIKKTVDSKAVATLRNSCDFRLTTGNSTSLFKGSHIVSGSALMLVLAVGENTMYGAIATELADEENVSPLKNRLSDLAKTISKIGYLSAAIVAAVHLADAFWFDAGCNASVALIRLADMRLVVSELIQALTMAISIVVVAVPEGLPMMITVVLSSNMKRMLKAGVLVRRLVGIETAGGVDILFTDKTGTLTTGKLNVSLVVTAEGEYDTAKSLPSPQLKSMKNGGIACAAVFNQTERALCDFLNIKSSHQTSESKDIIPFDSSRKFAAARYGNRLYIRGAAEYILPACSSYMNSCGDILPIGGALRQTIRDKISHYAQKSCRVLIHAEGSPELLDHLRSSPPSTATPLTFVSLFIIRDEIRKEAIDAVKDCRSAGVQVVMITGDNSETAAGIGVECGILSSRYRAFGESSSIRDTVSSGCDVILDGQTLRGMTDEDVISLLPQMRVISRVTPSDKSRLVKLAKASGHITGMTGDGINDAPALKSADVGFAMGSGTDIARQAGDIVITDDNFASITKAVLFGRTIFQSIRKFITFQLTMNLAAVGVSIIGTMFGINSPVTVIQMLWVNIIMDTLGSLAFAGEPALREYMRQSPVKRNEHILTPAMLWQILLTGGYAVALSIFFLLSENIRHMFGGGEIYHLTLFFALFVFMGVGIAMCTRTARINIFANILKNKAFIIIMPAVAAIQLLIIYFGGEVFRCVPLDGHELLICSLFAMTVIPADTIRKSVFALIRRRKA
ncbi:MAG: calcium-translocating P-type ATPase, PMCA-type [Ruminococcaceae bacterium]|nr:calcium-translocating P-type ATPase, PMCA-type [Oscillospiraceae bacterium]